MVDITDIEKKNNLYRDILNDQSHNELLECVKRTTDLKEKFSGMRLNRVNCTKEKIINAFLVLYEKNKIIEKLIMDMEKKGYSKKRVHIEESEKEQSIIKERGNKMNEEIKKTINNAEKSTEDLMGFSLEKFINSINDLKSENEKLKVGIEKNNQEIAKHKERIENNNSEAIKLSDKLKVANNIIKEKNSLIFDLNTRMDKLEVNLNERFLSIEKEVKKTVPAVDRTRELVDKNNNTLKEILVNVKEERKSLSKLQELESEMKGIESKVAESVLAGVKAIIEALYIDKREMPADSNVKNHALLEVAQRAEEKDKIKKLELKEKIINGKEKEVEEEDDELSRMLNDIRSVIN